MRTEIYPNLEAFYQREDKTLNGVTQRVADMYPECMEAAGNEGCWNCLECRGCIGCLSCVRCTQCLNLERCRDCVRFLNRAGVVGVVVPVVENIHRQVLEAVSRPGALRMATWHTCDTSHCRAGWVIHLAGQAGYDLAGRVGSEDAGRLIYAASSSQKLPWNAFWQDEDKAMADIRRCAAVEAVELLSENNGAV